MASPTIILVIPCFNEARRIDLKVFAAAAKQVRFLFVDDGSTDGTGDVISARLPEGGKLLRLKKNQGKAEAVRQGVLSALDGEKVDWIGYWDADLSTPLDEVEKFLEFAGDADGIYGSRVKRLGATIVRSRFRHGVGRTFATVSQMLLHLDAYDTQCGAKLFRPEVARKAFSKPFISRWIFDVEILLRLRGHRIIEYPLSRWEDVRGSKVRVFSSAIRIFTDLIAIRRRYL
ncbi:MAG: hypothetical protein RIQ81_1682 [Pseudomonadota bacterium]|jgi:glycosyltransferase involved in cell wall biosynthesis